MSHSKEQFDPPGIVFTYAGRDFKYVSDGHVKDWIVYRHVDGQWVTLCFLDSVSQLRQELTEAKERAAQLEAFETWVKTSPVDHKSGCPALWNGVMTGPNRKCTCGLSNLINSTKRK